MQMNNNNNNNNNDHDPEESYGFDGQDDIKITKINNNHTIGC